MAEKRRGSPTIQLFPKEFRCRAACCERSATNLKSINFWRARVFTRPPSSVETNAEGPKSVSTTSGFNLMVSDDDGEDLGARQVADALAFIERNRDDLRRLASRDDGELYLDFGGFFLEGMVAKYVRLPIDIVRERATLVIEIEVSVYAARSTDGGAA
jgi:hypothetical protein